MAPLLLLTIFALSLTRAAAVSLPSGEPEAAAPPLLTPSDSDSDISDSGGSDGAPVELADLSKQLGERPPPPIAWDLGGNPGSDNAGSSNALSELAALDSSQHSQQGQFANESASTVDRPPQFGFHTFLAVTFSDLRNQVLGDTVYVVVYPEGQQIALNPLDVDGDLSTEYMNAAADALGVTAIILVTQEAWTNTDYNIRWFSGSGTEYNICGHGNAGAAAALFKLGKPKLDLWTVYPPLRVLEASSRSLGADSEEVETTQTIGNFGFFRSKEVTSNTQTKNSVLAMLKLQANTAGNLRIFETQIGVVIQVTKEAHLKGIKRLDLCQKSDAYKISNSALFKSRASSNTHVGATATSGKQVDGWIVFFHDGAEEQGQKNILYRAFYPQLGVCEDEVTGSAFALVTASFHEHISKPATKFKGRQLSKDDGTAAGVVMSKVEGNPPKLDDKTIQIIGNVAELEDTKNFEIVLMLKSESGRPWDPPTPQGSFQEVGEGAASNSSAGTDGDRKCRGFGSSVKGERWSGATAATKSKACGIELDKKATKDVQAQQKKFWKSFYSAVSKKKTTSQAAKLKAAYDKVLQYDEAKESAKNGQLMEQAWDKLEESLGQAASLQEMGGTEEVEEDTEEVEEDTEEVEESLGQAASLQAGANQEVEEDTEVSVSGGGHFVKQGASDRGAGVLEP